MEDALRFPISNFKKRSYKMKASHHYSTSALSPVHQNLPFYPRPGFHPPSNFHVVSLTVTRDSRRRLSARSKPSNSFAIGHPISASMSESGTKVKPFSVLFVCLGNICRSPAAEGVFRDLVKKRGLDDKFLIDSAGTIGYHEVVNSGIEFCFSFRMYDNELFD